MADRAPRFGYRIGKGSTLTTGPYASNALAYLMGGGQVIFYDTEDVVAEILKFAQ